MADVKLQITREDDTTYDIDNTTGLKSVESLSQTTANPNEISYGFITSNGSAEILDKDSYILDSLNNESFSISNLNCSLLCNGQEIQSFPIVDSKYNIQSKSLSLYFGSMYDKMRDIIIPFDKDYSINGATKSLLSVIEDCFIIAGSEFYTNHSDFLEMFTEKIYIPQIRNIPAHSETIQTYLSNTKFIIGSYYRKEDSFFNIIDNICKATQLNILSLDNNKLKFVSARPILNSDKPVIKILPKNQLKSFEENIIINNKYNNISYKKNSDEIRETEISSYSWDITHDGTSYNISKLPNSKLVTRDGITWVEYFVTVQSSANYIKLLKVASTSFSAYTDLADAELTNGNLTTDIVTNPSLDSAASYVTIDTFSWASYNSTKCAVVLPYYSTINSEVIAVRAYLNENFYNRVGVTIWGRISDTTAENVEYTSGDNVFQYDYDNEFTHNCIVYEYNGVQLPLLDICLNNIIKDYQNGLRNATTTINCLDYYDIYGHFIKSWENGDIIENTDIIRIDKDYNGKSVSTYKNGVARLWNVVSAKFHKEGVPLLDLQLQEINISNIILSLRAVTSHVSLEVNRVSSSNQYATTGHISTNDFIYRGDILTFNLIPETGKNIETLTINGVIYQNGSQFDTSSIDLGTDVITLYCDTGSDSLDWTEIQGALGEFDLEHGNEGIVYTGEIPIKGLIADSKIRLEGILYAGGTPYPIMGEYGYVEFGVPRTNNITIYQTGGGAGGAYFKLMYSADGKLIYQNYQTSETQYPFDRIDFLEFYEVK